jgi:hypothetical protein
VVFFAEFSTDCPAGNKIVMRIVIISMTTSNSISVNPASRENRHAVRPFERRSSRLCVIAIALPAHECLFFA